MAEISESTKRAAVVCAEKHDVNHAARKFGVSVQSIEKWKQDAQDAGETPAPVSKPKRKYRRYSENFKKDALEYLETHTRLATAIRYNVTEGTITRWKADSVLKKAEVITESASSTFVVAIRKKLEAAEAECEKYREMLRIAEEVMNSESTHST